MSTRRLFKIRNGPESNLPDWLTIQPARQVNWRTGDGMNGKYASTKNGSSSHTESLLEMGFLDLLEWDWTVRTYYVQPVTMAIVVGGKPTRYTPDVYVRFETHNGECGLDCRDMIVEVKPRSVLKRDWGALRPKFVAAREWCQDRGVRFRIATDRAVTAQRLKNIRFLLNFRGARFVALELHEFHMRRQVEELARHVGMSTPRQLLEMLSKVPDRQAEYLPFIWNLITTGTLHVNLDAKLTMCSPVWHRAPRLSSSRSH